MPRIEVQPEQLSGASGRQASLSTEMLGLCGPLQAAAAAAAGDVGDAGVAGAIESAGQSWAASLAQLSAGVGRLGTNLGAAASAYTTTDRGAMPESGR